MSFILLILLRLFIYYHMKISQNTLLFFITLGASKNQQHLKYVVRPTFLWVASSFPPSRISSACAEEKSFFNFLPQQRSIYWKKTTTQATEFNLLSRWSVISMVVSDEKKNVISSQLSKRKTIHFGFLSLSASFHIIVGDTVYPSA